MYTVLNGSPHTMQFQGIYELRDTVGHLADIYI